MLFSRMSIMGSAQDPFQSIMGHLQIAKFTHLKDLTRLLKVNNKKVNQN